MWIDSQLPIGYSAGSTGPSEEEIVDEAQEQLSKADVDVVGCSCSTSSTFTGNRLASMTGILLLLGGLVSRRRKG